MTERFITGSVSPIPIAARSIDVYSVKVCPGVSAKEIFTTHSAYIISAVLDPIRLGNDLAAVNLVASTFVHGLATQHAFTNYEKTSQLVHVLSKNFLINDDTNVLLKICEILKKQEDAILDDIVLKMLKKIGQ